MTSSRTATLIYIATWFRVNTLDQKWLRKSGHLKIAAHELYGMVLLESGANRNEIPGLAEQQQMMSYCMYILSPIR